MYLQCFLVFLSIRILLSRFSGVQAHHKGEAMHTIPFTTESLKFTQRLPMDVPITNDVKVETLFTTRVYT